MSDNNIELSRRKILAGLGAVGAAGAGAGLGTSALFSDEETFEGNTITAGTLDLKVDWEEHYSYPQLYGFDDPSMGDDEEPLDVTRSEPDSTDDYQPLPDPQNPAVWVHQDDLDAYMDNTAIEAYPDVDGDGVQDDFDTGDVGGVCTDGADTSDDLDPSGLRTHNADTQAEAGGAPLVNLEDVKPGDFGELTLSYHLCSNPGYVWLGGELVDASENGVTEPEAASDEETAEVVELLDEIETTVWYDGDCDNVFEPGGEEGEDGQEVDVVLALDKSGSMSPPQAKFDNAISGGVNLVNALGSNDQVGLVSFGGTATLDVGLTTNHNSVTGAINGLTEGGGTPMDEAVQMARDELINNGRSGARKIMIVLGDGNADADAEATDAKDDGIEIFTIAYGTDADTGELQSMASDPSSNPESEYFFTADTDSIESLFQSLGGTVGTSGEEAIIQGTLREVLGALEDGDGIPLDGDLGEEGISPTPAHQTHCVGLSWHLPQDTGNHVQSDSVAFNVGFYAEQSRNNEAPAN
jgi:predicted ribosomally synthesized peptide with SipW-like signal peptide